MLLLLFEKTQNKTALKHYENASPASAIDNGDGTVTVLWNHTVYDSVMVRDSDTQNTLTIDRTGVVTVESASDRLELIYSTGLSSVIEFVHVDR